MSESIAAPASEQAKRVESTSTRIARLQSQRNRAPGAIATDVSPQTATALDLVQNAIATAEARIVALAGPRQGIATEHIARLLAENVAASGLKTLVIDVAGTIEASLPATIWRPGRPLGEDALVVMPGDFDLLVPAVSTAVRPLFNNRERLQTALDQDFADYDIIIFHLPPVLEAHRGAANPISVARAADAVLLMCATGRTELDDAAKAAEALRQADANLIGTILDDSERVHPGVEMAEFIERIYIIPGPIRRWLAKLCRTSPLLNE